MARKSPIEGDTSEVRYDDLQELSNSVRSLSDVLKQRLRDPATLTTQQTLDEFYRDNPLAYKIVDKLPDECTRRGWSVKVSERDSDEQSDPFDKEFKRLKLNSTLAKADKLARKDGGSAVYVVLDDGLPPDEPVDLSRVRRVQHLLVVERWYLKPVEWQDDLDEPDFGEPSVYEYTEPIPQRTDLGATRIHVSRLLLFHGAWIPRRLRAENDYWHDSVLRRVIERIMDFEQIERSITGVIDDYSISVMSLKGLKGLLSKGGEQIIKRAHLLNLARSVSRMVLLDKDNEQHSFQQRTVTGLPELYDRKAQSVASAAEMSVSMLFGQAPSGLSTDDNAGRTYWYDTVEDRQNNMYTPHIDRMVELLAHSKEGPVKGIPPESWEVHYGPLRTPTPLELSDILLKNAQRHQIYMQYSVLFPEEVRQALSTGDPLAGDVTLIEGLDDDIEEEAEEATSLT